MSRHIVYYPSGTCSRKIELDLEENGTVRNLHFEGGCSGNLKGICALCEGMKAEELIAKLEGTRCGFKPTSCPDQLAKALKQAGKAASR